MKKIFLFLVLCCARSVPVWAAFEINKLAPEASALNDAYSALGADPWAILYNPAQVVRLDGAQAAVGYSRPHIGFGNFQANLVSGLFTRQAFQTGYGVGVTFVDTNVFYREVVGLFNVGHRIGEKEDPWDLSLGTNLKILSLRRGDPTKPYDPALVPQTMNRFTADAGMHLRISNYYFGISMQNLIPANIGVVVKENVPIETRVGIGAINLWEIQSLGFKISPMIEVSNRNQDTVATGAARIQLLDFAYFNIGAGTRDMTFGFSVLLNQMMRYRKESRDSSNEGTIYRLEVGYQYPINGVDEVGSPLVGMSFLF